LDRENEHQAVQELLVFTVQSGPRVAYATPVEPLLAVQPPLLCVSVMVKLFHLSPLFCFLGASICTRDVEEPPSRRDEAAEPLSPRQQRDDAIRTNRQELPLLELVEPRADHCPHPVAGTKRRER
jgi:hypothetical protein